MTDCGDAHAGGGEDSGEAVGGGGDDREVATDAEHHEGDDGDGCDNRGTGMAVTVAIHEGGDVGGDRDDVDDVVSAGILESNGDGITGHGDDGVVPPRIEREEGGGSDGGVDDAAGNDGNDNAVVKVDDKDADDIRDNLSLSTKEKRKRRERTSADNDDGGGSGGSGGGGGG